MTKLKKLLAYSKKTFSFDKLVAQFNERRRYKQINDSSVLLCIILGLTSGLNSLNMLSQGSAANYSRSVLENFLNINGLPRTLRRYVASLIKKMKRGKMINLEHVKGKIIASVDGVETYRVQYSPEEFYKKVAAGLIDKHCQIAVHKNSKTTEIEYCEAYHRLVVICRQCWDKV